MKCDRCENQAVYTRKYSGEKLCSQCFSNSIVRKTAKTISKYNMIKNNELVAVAVSGRERFSCITKNYSQNGIQPIISEFKAITIDEGIPGYRNEALEIVEKFCEN